MEPTALIVIGLVATLALALLAIRWGLSRRARTAADERRDVSIDPTLPSGPPILRPSRIVVVGEPRASSSIAPAEPSPAVARPADPRRRLLRDTSAVLIVAGFAVVAVANLPLGGQAEGGVLSATATPAAAPGAGPSKVAGSSGTPGGLGQPSVESSGEASTASSSAPGPSAPAVGAASTPSPGRLALLTPCPNRTDCYLFVVTTRGDNLTRISRFFGVPIDAILRLNPSITDPSIIRLGSTITLPTPTR